MHPSQLAFGRQGHPSGRPLAREWPLRRRWGGGIDDGGDGISSLCLGETGRGLVCGPSMDPRRFSWRLVGMGIFLDVRRHWWRRNQVRCGGGGAGCRRGVRVEKGPRSTVRPHHGQTSVLAAIGRQGHPSGLPLASEWPVRRHWGRRNRRREGGMASSWRTGGKGSPAYCEAPPCTHVGSAGVWAVAASVCTAPGLGMAPPPSLGAEESTTGGGRGVVAACR